MSDKIDVQEVLEAMLSAVRRTIGEDVPAAQKYIESSARALAENTREVVEWLAAGTISLVEAQALMRLHERSAKMTLMAAETIGLVMAERAINAAIDAVRGIINKVLPVPLL